MTFMPYAILCLLIGLAMFGHWQMDKRHSYSCALCGSRRPDGHSKDCPWRSS